MPASVRTVGAVLLGVALVPPLALLQPAALAAQGDSARSMAQVPPAATAGAVPDVTGTTIARHLAALIADSGAPSGAAPVDSTAPRLERGMRYVAQQFARLELQPLPGTGGQVDPYFQAYPVPGIRTLNYDSTTLTLATFVRKHGTEVIGEVGFEAVRTLQLPLATATPLVGGMVGEGLNGRRLGPSIFGPTQRPVPVVVAGPHTPASAAEITVRGHVVFYVPPAGLDATTERAIVDTLARAGAGSRGVVVVTGEDSARFAARARAVRGPVPLVDDYLYLRAASTAPAWTVYVRAADSLAHLFALAGLDLAELQRAATPLVRAPLPLSAVFWVPPLSPLGHPQLANAVGVLEGSDSTLKQQYVVLTARLPDTGSAKARGDMAGIAAVLALAEAFRASTVRPRRSVLFAVTSGTSEATHEFAGAEFMAASVVPQSGPAPTWAAASLTFDLVGLSGGHGDSLAIAGLDEIDFGVPASWVAANHAEAGLTVVGGSVITGPCAAHCAFVRRKVPSLAIHTAAQTGVSAVSARAGAPSPPDPERTARAARLTLALVEAIANADRVRWSTGALERLSQPRLTGD